MRKAMKNVKKQRSNYLKNLFDKWLISNGFQGLEGQTVPTMSAEYIATVSNRYIELFENITGKNFVKADLNDIEDRIETNILNYFAEQES